MDQLSNKGMMCLLPVELSPKMDIAVARFHNFSLVISFKPGPCSFPGISGAMRNAQLHSEFMGRKHPTTRVGRYMETLAR